MNNYGFLGIVQNGRLRVLAAEHKTHPIFRLTGISKDSDRQPESSEIPLDKYERLAIMVRGIDSGEWIYSAQIIEQASSILTVLVQEMFKENKLIEFPEG